MSRRAPRLTPTSYALLGLLAIQPWTTYELARQMDRTLNWFWPRARSKVYEEPKKLVAHGLATAAPDAVGRRPRTVYRITPAGRRALRRWLKEPGSGPVLEFEQLMQVFFADSGSTDDVRHIVDAMREHVEQRTLVALDMGRAYLEDRGPFPQRAAVNQLVGRFLDDFLETVDRWADWAESVTDDWPADPCDAEVDRAALRETVARAERRAARARRRHRH